MNSSPYQPPMTPIDLPALPADLAKPAQRAGLLMIIVGCLTVVLAIGLASLGAAMPRDQYPPNLQQQIAKIETDLGVSWNTMLRIAGGIVAVPAVLMVIFGVFVRRGSMTAAVLGMVLMSLMALYLGMVLVQSIYALVTGSAQGAAAPVVFCIAAMALFGVQIFWLAKAIINAGPLKVFTQQHQAMAWQEQEQSRQRP